MLRVTVRPGPNEWVRPTPFSSRSRLFGRAACWRTGSCSPSSASFCSVRRCGCRLLIASTSPFLTAEGSCRPQNTLMLNLLERFSTSPGRLLISRMVDSSRPPLLIESDPIAILFLDALIRESIAGLCCSVWTSVHLGHSATMRRDEAISSSRGGAPSTRYPVPLLDSTNSSLR